MLYLKLPFSCKFHEVLGWPAVGEAKFRRGFYRAGNGSELRAIRKGAKELEMFDKFATRLFGRAGIQKYIEQVSALPPVLISMVSPG